MLILSAIRHRRHHVTAAALLEDVRTSYPFIDMSTIYRTLNSAKDLRLVNEMSRGSGETEYEWVGEDHHHHLICRSCGAEAMLDNSFLDSLAAALMEDHGFQADLDHFGFIGLCKRCLGAGEEALR
jgi:Fur family ferric uptake transcriptional regulator